MAVSLLQATLFTNFFLDMIGLFLFEFYSEPFIKLIPIKLFTSHLITLPSMRLLL